MQTGILDQQKAFAEAYVLGHGNATQAAIEAGYAPASARQTASRLLHTPHVQEAIRHAQAYVLRGKLASKALGVLEKILDDETAPAGVRVDAAKTVLDRAGLPAMRVPESVDDDRPLEAMTVVQLETFIAEGRALLGAAKVVTRKTAALPAPGDLSS